jgi:hypothetical protein
MYFIVYFAYSFVEEILVDFYLGFRNSARKTCLKKQPFFDTGLCVKHFIVTIYNCWMEQLVILDCDGFL